MRYFQSGPGPVVNSLPSRRLADPDGQGHLGSSCFQRAQGIGLAAGRVRAPSAGSGPWFPSCPLCFSFPSSPLFSSDPQNSAIAPAFRPAQAASRRLSGLQRPCWAQILTYNDLHFILWMWPSEGRWGLNTETGWGEGGAGWGGLRRGEPWPFWSSKVTLWGSCGRGGSS